MGILMAGKVPVPINFLLSPPELAHIVKQTGMDFVLTTQAMEQLPQKMSLRYQVLQELPSSLPAGDTEIADPDLDSLAMLLYTSGTTGMPKGVMLTQRNLVSNLEACQRAIKFDQRHIITGILPLFHTFALTCTMLLPITRKATVVYQRRFNPPAVLEALVQHKVTVMMAIPSMYRALIKAAQSRSHLSHHLEIAISGGEPLAGEVRVAFEQTFGIPLDEGYGLTETSPVVAVNTRRASKPGTIGKPLDNLEVRIADQNDRPLPPGSPGELQVRGPSVMKGYFKLPQETERSFTKDGFLRTGDMAIMDEEGFIRITGRIKEMIICSGENIYPSEIENVLCQHPAIYEAAVIGVPDKTRGEVPKAFVSLHDGHQVSTQEITDFCRHRLAPYKIPREVVVLPELPHSPTGKILKKALPKEPVAQSEVAERRMHHEREGKDHPQAR
jgi:long-chain acyl-CoA synthetase